MALGRAVPFAGRKKRKKLRVGHGVQAKIYDLEPFRVLSWFISASTSERKLLPMFPAEQVWCGSGIRVIQA